jgi:FMN phosphatase YigB (HAD superfamily)
MKQALEVTQLNAIIFDVDGTLYRQGPVRWQMLLRILRAHVTTPIRGIATLKAISAFRKAQESLRGRECTWDDAVQAQLNLACEKSGLPVAMIRQLVARWMEEEPLDVLPQALRKGTFQMLTEARRSGLRIGAYSDYPALEKLRAMNIALFFDVVVSAQDSEVSRFKPDPRGLEVTLRRLGAKPDESLYVGDRQIDAVAASRSGMRFVLISGRSLDLATIGLKHLPALDQPRFLRQ